MDHIMQLEEHHGLKLCITQDVARIKEIIPGASRIAFVLAAIAFLSMLASWATRASLSSSALSARILSLCSFAMTKKALFILSNAIFLFLAADCSFSPSSGDVTARDPAKQGQQHREMDQQFDVQPSVSSPGNLCHKKSIASENFEGLTREGEDSRSNAITWISDTYSSMPQAEQRLLGTVVVDEPACAAAQELEELEMDELNKKFDEFIQRRKVKWIEEEEAYLQREQDDEAPHCLQV